MDIQEVRATGRRPNGRQTDRNAKYRLKGKAEPLTDRKAERHGGGMLGTKRKVHGESLRNKKQEDRQTGRPDGP